MIYFYSLAFRKYFTSSITKYPVWAMQDVDLVAKRKDLPGILDIRTYLADAMLYKVDRSSMATSLEVRVPYLDNKVLEHALGLDFNNKSNAVFRNKAVLKQLLLSLAPHYDRNRPKKGFSFPLNKWLKQNWKEQVLESVTKNALLELNLDAKYFMNEVNKFYADKAGNHVEIWYLFNLVLWKKNYDTIKPYSQQ